MPPVISSTQSSRSGLITTVIASVTIAVIMIVVAVYFSTAASKSEKDLASLRTINRGMYYDGAPSDQKVLRLVGQKEQFPGLNSALEISMAQSEQLAKLLAGNAAPDAAVLQARSTISTVSKKVDELNGQKLINFTMPANASLTEVVNAMAAQLAQLAQDKKASDDQLVAAKKSVQDQLATQKAQLDEKDKQIAEAMNKVAAAEQKSIEYQTSIKGSLDTVTQTDSSRLKELQDANAKLTTDLSTVNAKLKASDTMVTGLKSKLHQVRTNPSEAVVQQPDGVIIRNSDNNRCFINIGSRQSVTLGLTFEVYDKGRGIPPLGDGLSDTNMPVGKASLEVVSVGPDTSECQVTKLQPGQQLVVGDFIANLVFDPNTKYNFFVYGGFDLSGSGAVNDNDAQIIKRLITQWGGKLQDHINVDTDFVVMGAEPMPPAGIDPNNPNDQIRQAAYRQAVAKYQAQVLSASQLSVPIMNQNRFLYFIGYFDQSKR
jgi:hypothetical protein